MKLSKLKIKGLMLVKTKIHKDKRGFFKENYKNKLNLNLSLGEDKITLYKN